MTEPARDPYEIIDWLVKLHTFPAAYDNDARRMVLDEAQRLLDAHEDDVNA